MLGFKVDFALLLYDEFDGAPITDPGVVFRHDGRIVTPLRKREGFYVFGGLSSPEPELEIIRPHYHRALKRVIKSCLDPGAPVEHVRLARSYPGRFSDCDWFSGDCPPDSEVLAFVEERQIKAQAGDGEGNRLAILGQAAGRLVGRRFALDMKKGKTFLIAQMSAPGVYLPDRELALPPKSPLPMTRAYLSRSGPDGRYHIPVEHGHTDKISGTAYYDRGKKKWVFASATARS